MQKYDVIYGFNEVSIEPHYCREWDDSGGCYGSNEHHGLTYEKAKIEVISFYENIIDIWKNKSEEEFLND